VLITVLIGYCYLTESPLNSVQLLWINLIMDTFAALALATMPPLMSVIDEPAITGSTRILQPVVWRQIYGITVWNVVVMLMMIFLGRTIFDLDYANATQTTDTENGSLTPAALAKKQHLTIIFNTFVFLQFFNEWNCRVVGVRELNIFKRFFRNWIFLVIMAVIFVVQWSSCKWLFFIFRTTYLEPSQFFRCVAWGSSVLLVAVILKLTPERWVEKMPMPIDESKIIGQGSILMRTFEKTSKGGLVKNN